MLPRYRQKEQNRDSWHLNKYRANSILSTAAADPCQLMRHSLRLNHLFLRTVPLDEPEYVHLLHFSTTINSICCLQFSLWIARAQK